MDENVDIMDEEKKPRGRKAKGRGFERNNEKEQEERYSSSAQFDTMSDDKEGPVKSVEGYIVFASGMHEEATEDDLTDKFSEFGEVKNLHLPLDRRTGFVKGYALIEYAKPEEAEEAIRKLNGTEFMDKKINVDWAFSKTGSKSRK